MGGLARGRHTPCKLACSLHNYTHNDTTLALQVEVVVPVDCGLRFERGFCDPYIFSSFGHGHPMIGWGML